MGGGKISPHGALAGTRIMSGLLAQEALVGTVTHANLNMSLGGTDRVMVGSGVVMAAADATNSRMRDPAQFGVFVVAKLMAPAALDQVGLIAAVDVLDVGPIDTDPLTQGLVRQGASVINECEDNGPCITADAFGVDLEVQGNGHECTGEQGVGAQFHCQIVTDHSGLIVRRNATQLGPREPLHWAELNEFPKQGADDMTV
jgi:hypothetical protein